MECIYLPELNTDNKYYRVTDTEAHHLKVLRLQSGDKIFITSGKGLLALATIDRISKNDFAANIIEFYYNGSELDFKIGLAIGIMDNRDRFEFAIEKCTEHGVCDIFPLVTDYSQQIKINQARLLTKTIHTIKQCKRSMLPVIHNPTSITDVLQNNDYDRIILADENGITPETKLKQFANSIIYVGPEGGFSEREIEIFDKTNIVSWTFGNRRLRTETSAIMGVSLLAIGF